MIFITKDKKLLKPGRFPSKNRGVFVLDCSDSTIMNTIYHLFDIGQYLWKKDFVLTDRRFMIGVDFFNELNLDGTLLKKY
jgi:hypothetical protein